MTKQNNSINNLVFLKEPRPLNSPADQLTGLVHSKIKINQKLVNQSAQIWAVGPALDLLIAFLFTDTEGFPISICGFSTHFPENFLKYKILLLGILFQILYFY